MRTPIRNSLAIPWRPSSHHSVNERCNQVGQYKTPRRRALYQPGQNAGSIRKLHFVAGGRMDRPDLTSQKTVYPPKASNSQIWCMARLNQAASFC